jgi:hypothetical protein
MFLTTRDILTMTLHNCARVKQLMQRKCTGKGVSCHEIDLGQEGNASLKEGIK